MDDITSKRQQKKKLHLRYLFHFNEPGYILCQNTKDRLLKKLITQLENMLFYSNLYKLAKAFL